MWKFAAVCLSQFFLTFLTVMLLQLHTVKLTRHHCDAPFIIHVFPVYKFCLSMIDYSSLQVPSCNIRNFTKFSAGHNNRPSTRFCQFGMQ